MWSGITNEKSATHLMDLFEQLGLSLGPKFEAGYLVCRGPAKCLYSTMNRKIISHDLLTHYTRLCLTWNSYPHALVSPISASVTDLRYGYPSIRRLTNATAYEYSPSNTGLMGRVQMSISPVWKKNHQPLDESCTDVLQFVLTTNSTC